MFRHHILCSPEPCSSDHNPLPSLEQWVNGSLFYLTAPVASLRIPPLEILLHTSWLLPQPQGEVGCPIIIIINPDGGNTTQEVTFQIIQDQKQGVLTFMLIGYCLRCFRCLMARYLGLIQAQGSVSLLLGQNLVLTWNLALLALNKNFMLTKQSPFCSRIYNNINPKQSKNLRKKKYESFSFLSFKLHRKAEEIKTVQHWNKNRLRTMDLDISRQNMES